MRLPFTLIVLALIACTSQTASSPQPARHLQIAGSVFRTSTGEAFVWRGITAFRLTEMVASGRREQAGAFLDWAASRRLTVLRVFTMASHLFKLAPQDGLRALPELLEMAAARGLHVEIVALADTAALTTDIEAHVKAVGAIAARYPNAILEIANEPSHATQSRRIHEPAELRRLASLVPDPVPVSLGSAEENEAFASGEYATFHFPRSHGSTGWGHVLALARGAALVTAWNKPVVNDEPIGAGPAVIPGRRDSDPDRFRAAALLSRLAGIGATFHYEQGLQTTIPAGQEARCFEAWNAAWTLLPPSVEHQGTFREAAQPGAAVASFDRKTAEAVFERQVGATAHVLVVNATGEPGVTWSKGWRRTAATPLGKAWLLTGRRGQD